MPIAVQRIYGDIQTAGISVTSTGKSQVSSDGTNAYAQLVALVTPDGAPYSAGGALASSVSSVAQTVTASAAALASQATTTGVILVASSNNVGTTYVGGSDVTTANGYPLEPGQSFSASVTNANVLYIIGTASDTVRVMRA